MAVVFNAGQQLTRNDLNIFIRDQSNTLFDPNYITFSVEDLDGKSLFIQKAITPVKETIGWYWANIMIPNGTPLGSYTIKWFVKNYQETPIEEIAQKFGIVKKIQQVTFTPTIGGVVYYPGQKLSDKDLYIVVRNHLGHPVDPYYIRYEVFQRISGLDILISPQGQSPLKLGVGHFYANYVVPGDALPGDYYIKWTFKETPSSDDRTAIQEFAVVTSSVLIESPYSDKETTLIRKLRFILRDNNPDRNYHFMPPAQEEVVQGFTQKFGYVWEDEELFEYIDVAVSELNNRPPREDWTVSSLPDRLYALILTNAAAIALRALSINWAHDEWSGDVSGIGLNLEKSSKYLAIKENLEASYAKQIDEYKDFGVRYIVGVRQPRYNVGVTSALGPYSRTGVQNRRNYVGSS